MTYDSQVLLYSHVIIPLKQQLMKPKIKLLVLPPAVCWNDRI